MMMMRFRTGVLPANCTRMLACSLRSHTTDDISVYRRKKRKKPYKLTNCCEREERRKESNFWLQGNWTENVPTDAFNGYDIRGKYFSDNVATGFHSQGVYKIESNEAKFTKQLNGKDQRNLIISELENFIKMSV
jgi:hypothetical protein